jgi:urease accessory protein
MSVAALLLGDSRFPAGGHAHSGGIEPAVTAGTVTDLGTLEAFLRGRLRTAGLNAAGVAAAACEYAGSTPQITKYQEFRAAVLAAEIPGGAGGTGRAGSAGRPTRAGEAESVAARTALEANGASAPETGLANFAGTRAWRESANPDQAQAFWAELDAEVDARTPSPAQREASRRQGRALLRAARVAWPDSGGLTDLAASVRAARSGATAAGGAWPAKPGGRQPADGNARPEYRGGPHHAVVLGAAAAAAGCPPAEAARVAAYQAVAGPVSAAVRLLALDPMRATRVLARLTGEIDQVASLGAAHACGPLSELPCASAPALDLLAEAHIAAEVRLFES